VNLPNEQARHINFQQIAETQKFVRWSSNNNDGNDDDGNAKEAQGFSRERT
jgi:hypothetical protein